MVMQSSLMGLEDSYKLSSLSLFNWGGFDGYHVANIDPDGTAIIGPTGSGKTTLVDALVTLLSHTPRYNLASTGGHESDRDLASYIRGVTGPGDGITQGHISRQGKTLSGICASLTSDTQVVRLAALFWFDDNSNSTADAKKLWLFSKDNDSDLPFWLQTLQDGGKRAITQLEKAHPSLWTFSSKKRYLTKLRDFFEVRENAFNLLNRAAGLKQLNSIDDIFRELVLDDHSQFERAKELADSFDDLTEIYQELEIARRQQQALEPIKTYWERYERKADERTTQQRLLTGLPVWFAQHLHQRLSDELDKLGNLIETATTQQADTNQAFSQQQNQLTHLRQHFYQQGGQNIHTLEELIEEKRNNLAACRTTVRDYQAIIKQLELNDTLDRQTLHDNQAQANRQLADLTEQLDAISAAHLDLSVQIQQQETELNRYRDDLCEVKKRPGSNIPAKFHAFRSLLAEHLACDEDALPFVAELVQVKPKEQAWRGAIERAIGSQRLRILVSPEQMQPALSWINQRDNRLHVRLLEVDPTAQPQSFFSDSYLHKLNIKTHPYADQVKALLASYDRHCVNSVEALRQTPHAMTQQGLMSGKARFYDKQDQKRLDANWLTGFDNRDRLALLAQHISQLEQQIDDLKQARQTQTRQKNALSQQQLLVEQLCRISFEEIDQTSKEADLAKAQARLDQLTAEDSDLSRIKLKLEEAEQQLQALQEQKNTILQQLARLDEQRKNLEQQKHKAWLTTEKDLDKETLTLCKHHFADLKAQLVDHPLDQMDSLERTQSQALNQQLKQLDASLSELRNSLIRAMERAKREDRGELSEVGSELIDVPDYLNRLQQLVSEALPAKQARFKDYLNRSSDDGVIQLLQTIEGEVDRIRDKLEDVNHTLARVDFQQDQYLQLLADKVQHENLRSFKQKIKRLRAARLDDDEGESQYQILQAIIGQLRQAFEARHRQASKSLLDPRFRLAFKVVVLDRQTDQVLATRTSSQGGSGGEKEIIASYVLTASLSYALCPDGSDYPLFSSIVLDEAFSRSSHVVAGRIIAALAEFKLHPIFVTPNKEMRLLRNHTRSAIVVHRVGKQSSLMDLSWQALDEMADKHRQQLRDALT